ncbi:DEAD/DEAH box helicase family protein [Candidatus Woesearchaeota archaeon]|nr:DEAD/DEAH box helicase family protein [Candidatus Woesearchaeota archaeon]
MKPRLYQEKILATAAMKNTLVVLPTGLGKSLIAKLLAEHRLQKRPGSKIVIFAPTKPLAAQHLKLFDDAILLTGTVKPENRVRYYEESQVIISTPQGFENDLINKRISLDNISLMVFDEAHHATGNYAYTFIASEYRKVKDHLILGLTASPGSNQESIEEILENLGIESIEYRTQNDPDVKPYVQSSDVTYLEVRFPKDFEEVKLAFERVSKTRLDRLKALNVFTNKKYVTKKDLIAAQKQLQGILGKGDARPEHYVIISTLAEITKVQHAQELLETQGIKQLHDYVEKICSKDTSKAAKNLVLDSDFKFARLLIQRLNDAGTKHPKLEKLSELIEQTKTPTFKAIVFTQFRDSAKEIITKLNMINEINAKLFVGQAKKNGSGLSQKEQIQMLKDFSEGKFNVLVSSSVGEEGLDIPAVDEVIFYEPVPSAIRAIQRRGRTGRLEEGKVFILTTKGTRDEAYRWSAHQKEKNQYSILAKIKGKPIVKENPKPQKTLDDYDSIIITADYREKSSAIFKNLLDEGAQVRLENLEVGDYIVSEKVGIEFKTRKDFVDSLIDGRLIEQVKNLKSNFATPVLIVEGEDDLYGLRQIHPNAIRGLITSITLGFNINIVYTKDPKDTALMIYQIARREKRLGSSPNFHMNKQKRSDDEELEYLLTAIPGIGIHTARELLQNYKSIKNIFNSNELSKTKGIGKDTENKIQEIFSREYKK